MKGTLIIFISLLFSMNAMGDEGTIIPRGEVFAYFRITEAAFTGPNNKKTGYYFYKDDRKDVAGPILIIYEYKDGKIIDTRSTGSISAEVFKDIESIGLVPFDFYKETKATSAKIIKTNGIQEIWVTADGQEWEVMINTENGQFLMKGWNPGSEFRNYSMHSENISKLEKVIRRLTMYYGETVIGIL